MTRSFPTYDASPLTTEFVQMPQIYFAFGAGQEQRVGRGVKPKREWRVVFTDHDFAYIGRMDSFLKDHNGVQPFRWRPPRGYRDVTVTCAQWNIQYIAHEMASLRAIFIESTIQQTRR